MKIQLSRLLKRKGMAGIRPGYRLNVVFLTLFLCQVPMVNAQDNASETKIIGMLDEVSTEPVAVPFVNHVEVNGHGGHLQGIQKIEYDGSTWFFLTGSSDSYSYLAVVDGDKGEVVSINKLLDRPFKHAGGFQIYKNLMAIGIEDNSGRKRSKVYVWRLDDLLNISSEPMKVIEREGEYERATAGCVAISEIDGYILVVVGDWDTRHLDFYTIRDKDLHDENVDFEKVYSITTSEIDKTNRFNDEWGSYQNINLLKDSSGGLFLAGMSKENGENVLDLFKITTREMTSFDLQKVYSKKFGRGDEVNFDWGAGVFMNKDKMEVLTCPAHLRLNNEILIFK